MAAEPDLYTDVIARLDRLPRPVPEDHQDHHPPVNVAASPETLTLEQLLERFVHVARGPMIVDAKNTRRHLRPNEFAAAYGHLHEIIGTRSVALTSLWSQSDRRMIVDGLAFNPAADKFYAEHGLRFLNQWTEPSWPAVDPALAAPLWAHLEYLIPDATQRADLIDWIAHATQRPEVRPHFHFLLMTPTQGTGRSWLGDLLVRIYGERHAGKCDLHKLLDDPFNADLSGKIFMAVNEVKAPADERYSHRDRLKSLLTDVEITINEKHQPRWTERFCARFLMFSNAQDAIPLSETDRRIYAVRCTDKPRDEVYYRMLYGRLDDEQFLAAVWHALRSRDISGFNPGRRAPLNEMKAQLIAAGRTDEQQSAVELVRLCPHDVVGAVDLMRTIVDRDERESRRDYDQRVKAIAAALRDVGCQTFEKKIRVDRDITRAWILRNGTEWAMRSPAAVREAAEAAHLEFEEDRWIAEALINRWSKS